MNVNDVVAAKVEAARVKIQASKRRREELSAARRRGLAARHAAKLRAQANPRRPQAVDKPTKETPMPDRALTSAPVTTAADDIRDQGYAIVQTRIERVPARYRSTRCGQPDGCDQPATLVTLGLAQVDFEGDEAVGFHFARDAEGEIIHFATCDGHRCDASHVLFYELTGRTRPDGIRAYDVLGQHMNWTAEGGQS